MPASVVLGSSPSSHIARDYAFDGDFACGLADDHFEHPASKYRLNVMTRSIEQVIREPALDADVPSRRTLSAFWPFVCPMDFWATFP